MFWICLAWYLVGVAIMLIGMKLIEGYVTLDMLITALIFGGLLGPMSIPVVCLVFFVNSEVSNKKLF